MADLLDHLELLDWLPDETLFSLVSRLHLFWGFPLAGQTCEVLFGHHQQGSQHDLPSRLDAFVSRTNQRYGSAADLATLHTLLAYYRPFVGAALVDEAVQAMATNNVAHLKLRLGMLTSRFRAHHPLKACQCCIGEDIERHGWSYWRLAHQYPGVWVCLKHACWLRMSSLKATGVERFHWLLPSQADLRALGHSQGHTPMVSLSTATSLAQLILNLTACKAPALYTSNLLDRVYRFKLAELGWTRTGGSIRWSAVTDSYCRHVQALVGCPDIPSDMQMSNRVSVQLGRMLRGARSGTHPLRHFLIIHWLFEDFERFDAAVQLLLDPSPSGSKRQQSKGACLTSATTGDDRHWQLRDLLLVEGYTITGAARSLGVDVATAMVWATKMGIPVLRRAKKLKGGLRCQAIAMLRSGADKADVANRVGISVQTVTRLALTEVGLQDQWRTARFELQRDRYRAAWMMLMSNHGGAGIKILRSMEPATFAWLYRHDRDWLYEHKPLPVGPSSFAESCRVDWDGRDQLLSTDVLAMGELLFRQNPGKSIKLWQIYRELPELKAKLGALDKLPLTRKALERVVSARRRSGRGLFD